MPKQRDYRAEYQRRIQSGMARGLTRSQAAGHPKPGEVSASARPFVNPFAAMRDSVVKFISDIQSVFGGEPSGVHATKNDVEYIERVGEYGVNSLPRWSIGSDSHPADLNDFKDLFNETRDKRYQQSYTMVVCGYLEETYPGHDPDEPIECISYRIGIGTIRHALNQSPDNLTDFMNLTLPDFSHETWLQVNEVQFIDKE